MTNTLVPATLAGEIIEPYRSKSEIMISQARARNVPYVDLSLKSEAIIVEGDDNHDA